MGEVEEVVEGEEEVVEVVVEAGPEEGPLQAQGEGVVSLYGYPEAH